jgi:hypoxanthine-DNA glycosylase
MKQYCLPPLVTRDTSIIILGSMPSEKSIATQQYYANPTNDFWKIVGTCINKPLDTANYSARIAALQHHDIGLWDIYAWCEREGSMDDTITKTELNDFLVLFDLPLLERICLNGKSAGKHASRFDAYPTLVLPSTSGANRAHAAERLAKWRDALTLR